MFTYMIPRRLIKVTHLKFVFLDSVSKQHWPICEHIRRFDISIETLRTVPALSDPYCFKGNFLQLLQQRQNLELEGNSCQHPRLVTTSSRGCWKNNCLVFMTSNKCHQNFPLKQKFGISLVYREPIENPFLSLSMFSGWLKVQNSPHLKGFSQSEGQRLVQPVKAVGSNHPWNAANVIILKWIYCIHATNHENYRFETWNYTHNMYTRIALPTWEQYTPTQVVDHH